MRDLTRRLVALLIAGFALAAWPLEAGPRPVRFDRLSLEQGLSQSTVLSVYQDSQGFLWVATEDGLNRYDGYQFRVYKHDSANLASLPNNVVWDIAEDASSDLWIATEGGGLAKWVRKTDSFVSYGKASGLASERLRALLLDRKGQLWVGTRDAGLDRFDTRTGAVAHFRHDPKDAKTISNDSVYALLEDPPGSLWVGTNDGLNRLDPAAGTFERFFGDAANPHSLSDSRVRSLGLDGQGNVWVGTQAGLNRLLPDGGFERFGKDKGLSDPVVRALHLDDKGRLWVGTAKGLDLLDLATGKISSYLHDPADPSSLGDAEIMTLEQDRNGVVWVGTRSAGLHRFNPRSWAFGHHRAWPGDPDGLSANYVTSFAEDAQQRLWVGTLGGGLNLLDRASGRYTHFRHDPRQPASLPDDRVMALLYDRQGTLWVGTMDGGLGRYEGKGFQSYRHDPTNPASLSANAVVSLYEDSRGTLWVGTFGGGLNSFDRRSGRFVRYRNDPANPSSLGGDIVTCFAEDPSGALWVGTDGGGLSRFDPRAGTATVFRNDPTNPRSLPNDSVFALLVDTAGTLWVGTRGGGLSMLERADPATGRLAFRSFNEKNGLPNAMVYAILPDLQGNLWLTTNRGVAVFDTKQRSFRRYSAADGLQSNEFNFGARLRSPSGELFIGGVGGFNAFFPERLEASRKGPAVAMTAILKSTEPITTAGPVSELKTLELGPLDRSVTFEFAALDFSAPERNRYAHKLEGFDKNWIELGTHRRVTYTNLDPGRYQLRVRGSNADGVWSENDLTLSLVVAPPLWRTWWAYVGYIAMLGGGVGLVVAGQRRRLARDAEYRERLEVEVEERTQELAGKNSELETVNRKLLETSLTDSLTGLRNRRFLFEEVSRDLALAQRQQADDGSTNPHELVFIMVDLDWFKPINDTCGHAAGDRVLKQVRDILEAACRKSDVLIRWGGDEFLVIGRAADLRDVQVVPERIRSTIERSSFDLGNGQVARLTCSVGFTCFPFAPNVPTVQALSLEQTVALADAALYVAKRNGRNSWVGLLGTPQTTPEDVARSIQDDPEQLAAKGSIQLVRSSRPVGGELALLPHSRPAFA